MTLSGNRGRLKSSDVDNLGPNVQYPSHGTSTDKKGVPMDLKMAIRAVVEVYFSDDYGPVATMDVSGRDSGMGGYYLDWTRGGNVDGQTVSGINEAIQALKEKFDDTVIEVMPYTYFSVDFYDDHGQVAWTSVNSGDSGDRGHNLVWKKDGKRDARMVSGIVEAIEVVKEIFDANISDATPL